MPGKIFVNYRRDDARDMAARIRDRLAAAFGEANVFMDVDNLMAGQRFDKELEKALAETDVFLAVIGPRWLELLAERQTSGERDYVRMEIAEALRRGIVVIPVLIELTPLPRDDELPGDIRELVLHLKRVVTHEQFGHDIARLVEAIRRHRGEQVSPEPHYIGPGGEAEREWRAHDLDNCMDPGLLRAYADKWETADKLWSYKARQRAAGLETPQQNRKAEDPTNGAAEIGGHAAWATEAEKRRFLADVAWNDLSGTPHNDPAQRRELADRFKQFMKLPGSGTLIDGLAMYVARCLPFPARTAYYRWVVSIPQQRYFANISVGGQWTASCFEGTDGPLFRFFGRGSVLRREFGFRLERLPAYCHAENATEVAGGPDQMRLVCRPSDVARLLAQEAVVEALRDVALYLAEGETPYKQHHCFDLADAILIRARRIWGRQRECAFLVWCALNYSRELTRRKSGND